MNGKQVNGEAGFFQAAAADCACTNFRRASRAVTQRFDEALEPSGLRSTQFAILVAVAAMAPASVAKLSRELVMDASTVNRNLKPLVARGLIDKGVPDGRGRGRLSLSVTEAGNKLLTDSVPLWKAAQESFVSAIGAEQWPSLKGNLNRAVEAARADR